MDVATFAGPVDYTELVYMLHCYAVAEQIKQDVREWQTADREAVAWASRWHFLPHVDIALTESSLPDADSC